MTEIVVVKLDVVVRDVSGTLRGTINGLVVCFLLCRATGFGEGAAKNKAETQ